ncbi:MAG: hypothetical protein A2636_01840 [Elusimicrobia bacterium RIFCSPHIGHO2_01_FULL_64_10]|nr:MAG: hypothetical protein A2636_01840 [Elusimicrobia bacterium RIFCSPHIGHO2_01_FULL_64_10]
MTRHATGGQVVSWAFYDFANSAFATVILAVVFNVYFVGTVCAGGVRLFGRVLPGESVWGLCVSASTLAVFLISPVLGAAADVSGSKKSFLGFFCALGVLFTGLLFFSGPGGVLRSALCFIAANIGFAAGNTFYNALLNDVSGREDYGRVSGFGWALGYIGGGLALLLCLWFMSDPEAWGMAGDGTLPARSSFLAAAVWWGLFSLPVFLGVKESRARDSGFSLGSVREGFRRALATASRVREHREVFKFLLAYVFYNDGIETVIIMAAVFGSRVLGFAQKDLVLCFLLIQGVAFFGSLIFGRLADAAGHKRAISLSLWVFLAVCLWGAAIRTQAEFWVLGGLVGLVLGGSQAASRSFLALLAPAEKSAEFFGFFALTGKLSSVLGPLVFAVLAQTVSLRAAVAGLGGFFALGLAILYFVREPFAETHDPLQQTV